MHTTTEFIMHIIPTTIVDAFAQGEILQVLLISVLFGFALHPVWRQRHAGLSHCLRARRPHGHDANQPAKRMTRTCATVMRRSMVRGYTEA